MKYLQLFEQYDIKIIKRSYKLFDDIPQKILNKYETDLTIFSEMKTKGMDKVDRNVNLYFDAKNNFVGFLVFNENHLSFDKNKKVLGFDVDSKLNTVNIADVEVKKSIRDKIKGVGKNILDDFISSCKGKYDGITLQAHNDKLKKDYYPRYGFIDLKMGGNAMVLWL